MGVVHVLQHVNEGVLGAEDGRPGVPIHLLPRGRLLDRGRGRLTAWRRGDRPGLGGRRLLGRTAEEGGYSVLQSLPKPSSFCYSVLTPSCPEDRNAPPLGRCMRRGVALLPVPYQPSIAPRLVEAVVGRDDSPPVGAKVTAETLRQVLGLAPSQERRSLRVGDEGADFDVDGIAHTMPTSFPISTPTRCRHRTRHRFHSRRIQY